MASQQQTHFNCKNCGSLLADKFTAYQIDRFNDETRECKDCKEKAAEARKTASQLARLEKHAERVVIILPADAVDTRRPVRFKRAVDGEPKDCVISCLRLSGRPHVPRKTSVTSRELVAAGATVDPSISTDAMIQLPCTGKDIRDFRGGKRFKVNFVTIDGAVFDIQPQITVRRFEQGNEPTVEASSMKLLLASRPDFAAAARARGTGANPWRDKGNGHDEVRKAILDGDWDLLAKLCRKAPYVQELKYPEGCLKPNAHVVKVRFYNVHEGGRFIYGSFGSPDEAVDFAARHVAANIVSRFVKPGDDMLSEAPASLLQDVKDSEEECGFARRFDHTGKWMGWREDEVGKGRLDPFLARHPPGVHVLLSVDGSLNIRARIGANAWQKCETIDEAERVSRAKNPHVRGIAEAREKARARLDELRRKRLGLPPREFDAAAATRTLVRSDGHGGRSQARYALLRVDESLLHTTRAIHRLGFTDFTARAPGACFSQYVCFLGDAAACQASQRLAPLVTKVYDIFLDLKRNGDGRDDATIINEVMMNEKLDVALWGALGYDIRECRDEIFRWYRCGTLNRGKVFLRESLLYAPVPLLYAGDRESHVYSAYAKHWCNLARIELNKIWESYSERRSWYEQEIRAGRQAYFRADVRELMAGARDKYDEKKKKEDNTAADADGDAAMA